MEHEITPTYYQIFLSKCEGIEGISDDIGQNDNRQNELIQMLLEMEIEDEHYLTERGEINGIQTVVILNDQAVRHAVTGEDIFDTPPVLLVPDSFVFIFEDRYSSTVFQGIMPDSGAAGVSTAGQPQFLAL